MNLHVCVSRLRDSPNLTGFNPPPGSKVDVVLHVLIPVDVWEWNDNCRVHVRFGHFKLGNWEKDIGDFNCVKLV